MKKLFLSVLPILALGLAACGGDSGSGSASGSGGSGASSPTSTPASEPESEPDPSSETPDVPTPTGDTQWYVVGAGSFVTEEWAIAGGVQCAAGDSGDCYTILYLETGDQFKFAKEGWGDWQGTYHLKAEGVAGTKVSAPTTSEDNNIEVLESGVYVLSIVEASVGSTPNQAIYVGDYEAAE